MNHARRLISSRGVYAHFQNDKRRYQYGMRTHFRFLSMFVWMIQACLLLRRSWLLLRTCVRNNARLPTRTIKHLHELHWISIDIPKWHSWLTCAKTNREFCFVHVQYVGFFDDAAKEVENKNRVWTGYIEIFHVQFQILEDAMYVRNEHGRTICGSVCQSIVATWHKSIITFFARDEVVQSRELGTFLTA